MTTCICQGESFAVGDSRAHRPWMMATAGAGRAPTLTAIVSLVSSLMPSTRAHGSD